MDEDSGKKMRGRARGRGRGRARGRVRGRTKKPMKVIESDDEETSPNTNNEDTPMEIDKKIEQDDKKHSTTSTTTATTTTTTTTPIIPTTEFDLEADISQLEAPTFTTLNRGPPEPMLRLRWDHRVNLIGEKVLNPMIHCCDKCLKPILIYGRMIPCKHVFCLSCGKREDKVCPRCMDKVSRVEQTGLGTVFMCTHGGTRYGNAGCRRTYLSQRDLQAHINHRHILVPPTTLSSNQTDQTTLFTHTKTDNDTSNINKTSSGMMNPIRIKQIQSHMATQQQSQLGNDPRVNSSTNQTSIDHRQQQQQQQQQSQQQQQHNRPQQIMTMQNYTQNSSSTTSTTMRTNLITVPIQDNSINHDIHSQQQQQQQQSHHYYQQAQVGYGYNVPPPAVSQNQNYYSGQVNYPLQQQQQQQGQGQYIASSGNIRPSPNGYIQQDGQYSQQQVPTSQTGWNQHQQQQFYR